MAHHTSRALRCAVFTGVTLSALVPATVSAQEAGFFELDPIYLEQLDPEAGAADRATAVYVAEAEREKAALGDLKDLFAGIASASVGGAIPVAQKIFVNGVDMLNLSVTVDGVMQNNRMFHHTSANAFDPGLLKFVRVDPGIAAADTGPNALAGAVVMETIDASDFLEGGETFGGKYRLGYSDNGKTFSNALTLVGRQGGFEWLLYGRRDSGQDYTTGAGVTQHGTAADLSSGLAKLAFEAAEGHRFEFSAQQMVDDGLRPYRANISNVITTPQRVPLGAVRQYDTRRSSYSLSYHNTQASDLWDPEITLGYSENVVNVPVPFNSKGDTNTWSGTFKNTFHMGSDNTITAGVDVFDRTSRYDATTAVFKENARNIGLFAQARYDLSPELRISTGLRYDSVDFTGTTGFKKTYSGASGNLSATYFVTDDFSVRAGYSNVFGGVDIEDNYLFPLPANIGWDYSNLLPARSENTTVGFDWEVNQFKVGGELFRTKIKNARNNVANLDFQTEGYNLGVTYGWGSGFSRLTYSNSEISVNGAATNSFAALDFGTPIGQVLALEVQQELPQLNMVVGGSVDWAADFNGTAATANKALQGYTVLNLFAEYRPPAYDNVVLRAAVDNVFDVAYADRASYGAEFNSVNTIQEPGRTVKVELSVDF